MRDITPDGRAAIFHEQNTSQVLDAIIVRDRRTGRLIDRTLRLWHLPTLRAELKELKLDW